MILSPNKLFFIFFKQKLDKKYKKNSDLPTLICFGMLAETRFSSFFFLGLIYLMTKLFKFQWYYNETVKFSRIFQTIFNN